MDKEIALIDSNFFENVSEVLAKAICQWSMHTMKLEK